MPVTKITQKIDGLSGGWSLDGGFNLAVSVYIQCTPGTDPEAMLRSLGLPVGATYRFPLTGTPTATNPRLFLESISIDSVDGDGAGAHLTAKFTPADPSKDDRGPVDEHGNRDPFAAPPKLRWATEAEEFAVTHDKAGQPILNAAGEPYESGVVIPLSTPIAVVSRLAREFDEAWLDVYKGRINSVPWMGFPAGSVLCKDITADLQWLDDVGGYGWAVEYQFAFKPPISVDDGGDDVLIRPGWSAVLLNAGLREKVGGQLKAIMVDNAPVSSPYALKADGARLGPSDDPVYDVYDVYPEVDFAGLGLPTDLFSRGTPEPPPEEA